MAKIQVLTTDRSSPIEKEEQYLGKFDKGKQIQKNLVKDFDSDILKSSIKKLTSNVSDIFEDLNNTGKFKLKEITITAEITAEGKIILIGGASVKGGITLKFEP